MQIINYNLRSGSCLFFLSCFQNVLNAVKDKFVLPDSNELDACDGTNTVIEEDILFFELIESSPDLCLKVGDRIPDAITCTPLLSIN